MGEVKVKEKTMEEKLKVKDRLIDFFKDEIFIYALISAIIVTYFYLDYKRYTFFGPILNEFVEFVIPPILWIIYNLKTKKTFLYNFREIFNFSIIYSIFLALSSIILDFTVFRPQFFLVYFSWLIGRILIIYIWIAFINVVCRTFVNMYKFIFKK